MALNTMKEVTSVGDFEIKRVTWRQPKDNHIEINDDANAITFKLQNGPIKEHGVNGCQVDTIIEAAMMIVEGLNEEFSCFENEMCVNSLERALLWLEKRKQDREAREVEGENKA